MKRLFSRIASSPETVSTSLAGSKAASAGSVLSRYSIGSRNSLRNRWTSSCGEMQTYCVPDPVRTECTMPFEARRSSVEYTFDDGMPADFDTSLPFWGPWRSRPT